MYVFPAFQHSFGGTNPAVGALRDGSLCLGRLVARPVLPLRSSGSVAQPPKPARRAGHPKVISGLQELVGGVPGTAIRVQPLGQVSYTVPSAPATCVMRSTAGAAAFAFSPALSRSSSCATRSISPA